MSNGGDQQLGVMNRRCFLKSASLVGAGVVTGCASATGHLNVVRQGNTLVLEKALFRDRPAVSVATENFPVGVYKLGAEAYAASLMACTHQSCETAIADDGYICPCHGSRFGRNGEVLKGPARRDLKSYRVTTDQQRIYVHLNAPQT